MAVRSIVADPLPCVNDRSLAELCTVTDDEVEAAIKKLPNKSSPPDVLPISLLKLCLPEIVSMITNIANASFNNNSGRFPAKLKLGQTTPLLKKAGLDVTDDCNFRPIYNLPTSQNYLKDSPCPDCNRICSVPRITVPYSLHTGPYIPLRPLCSRSLMISTDRWTMVPLLPWSASTSLLLTIPLIVVNSCPLTKFDGGLLLYCAYMKQMRLPSTGCQHMALSTR